MTMCIKNIKKNEIIKDCSILSIKDSKYLLFNRIDRLDLYNLDLQKISEFNVGCDVKILVHLKSMDEPILLLITYSDEYFIFYYQKFFKGTIKLSERYNLNYLLAENLTEERTEKHKYLSQFRNKDIFIKKSYKNLSLYDSCYLIKDTLVLVSKKGDVLSGCLENNTLTCDDSPNDFKFYKIIHISSDYGYLVFLVSDIENNVFILKYMQDNLKHKIKIKSKISRGSNTKYISLYKNGWVALTDESVIYEEESVVKTEFGNSHIASSIKVDDLLILSTMNGELQCIEASNQGIKIKMLGKYKESFKIMKNIHKTLFFAYGDDGSSYVFELKFERSINSFSDSKESDCKSKTQRLLSDDCYRNYFVAVRSKIKSVSQFKDFSNEKNGIVIYNDKHLYKLVYEIDTDFIDIITMNHKIKLFGMYKDFLIVSYSSKSIILKNRYECFFKTDEIKNLYIKEKCYFNTKSRIFIIDEEMNMSYISFKDILLSSYKQKHCVVFTRDRRLHKINLKTSSIEISKDFSFEVCFLLYADCIYVSTYKDELILLDDQLRIKETYRFQSLKQGCIAGDRLFFGDFDNRVYEWKYINNCEINKNLECDTVESVSDSDLEMLPVTSISYLLSKMYPKDKNLFNFIGKTEEELINIIHIKDCIYILSQDPVIYNIKTQNKSRLSCKDIQHMFYNDGYFISIGKNIFKCKLNNMPEYKFLELNSRMNMVEEENIYYNIRFIEVIDKVKVVGITEIRRNKKVITKIYLETNKKQDNLILKNTYLIKGRCLMNNFFTLLLKNLEENYVLCLCNLKNKQIEVKYKLTFNDRIINMHSYQNYLLCNNSDTIFVYKQKNNLLVELSNYKIDTIGSYLYMYKNRILVIDYFRSFLLLEFNESTNDICLTENPFLNTTFNKGIITDRHVILSSDDKIHIYKDGKLFSYRINHVNNFFKGSISLDKRPSVYLTTDNSSIFVLQEVEFTQEELSVIKKILGTTILPDTFLNIDLLTEKVNNEEEVINKNVLEEIKKKISRVF